MTSPDRQPVSIGPYRDMYRICARCRMSYAAHVVFDAMPRNVQEEIGYPPCPEFVKGNTLADQLSDLAEAWAPVSDQLWGAVARVLDGMTRGIERLTKGRRP